MVFYSHNFEMETFLKNLIKQLESESRPNLHNNISVTWVNYKDKPPASLGGEGAGWLEDKLIYPASVIKLFYACAIEEWLNKDLLIDCAELRRALSEMIINSSNDATSYIVDLLTATTSGPSLKDQRWEIWKKQRNIINKWLKSFNWDEFNSINCCQKTWSEGPFGRDSDFYGKNNENKNSLSTIATGKLLEALMTGILLNPKSTHNIKKLLFRSLDILKRKEDKENQIDGFIGEGLPKGSKLWSKAGFMSEARHDATWFITPNKNTMLLIVFCKGKNLAKDNSLLPSIASEISKWIPK